MSALKYLWAGIPLLAGCGGETAAPPMTQPSAGAAGTTSAAGVPATGGTPASSAGQASGGALSSNAGAGGGAGAAPVAGAGTGGAIAQTPGKLTFQKQIIHEQHLAESATIGDFNHDGNADIASGRRWWEGPAFTVQHPFRRGHEALPPEEPDDGVSDDWADYAYDIDGNGWDDIVVVASPDTTEKVGGQPIIGGEGYWYESPGAAPSDSWQEHLISKDIRMEQRAIIDMNKDGFPDLLCGSIGAGKTKGYYQANKADVTAPWTFKTITRAYDFYGNGWIHGIGAGDVDGNGTQDLLERAGYWLQTAGGTFDFVNVGFSEPEALGTEGNVGGAHMFAYDVDGDGDSDIVTSLNSHGFKLVRDAQGAHFEPHLVDDKVGTGRQFQVGHLDKNGTLDIVIGGKKGLFVFRQDP